MMTNDTVFDSLLLLSNAAMLAAAAIAVVRFQHLCRRSEKFWNSPTGSLLTEQRTEQPAQEPRPTVDLERRITELQRVIDNLAVQEPTAVAQPSRSLPIENAVRMAQRGATSEELARVCGLNAGEAQLMKRLHSNARPVTEGESV